MAEIGVDNLIGNFSFDFGIILWVLLIGIGLVSVVFIVFKIKEKKSYDTLVEITPRWAIQEQDQWVSFIPEQTGFQKLIGFKPKEKKIKTTMQSFQTYFVRGAYLFNKKNGSYEIKFWDGLFKRTTIVPVDYEYFQPITGHKWAKRRLKLIRTSPLDYKPVKSEISGYKEIHNIVDNEATFAQFKTMEEIDQKFKKTSIITQFLPYIFAVVAMVILGLFFYMSNKQYNETMTTGFQALASSIQANTDALKLYMSNVR